MKFLAAILVVLVLSAVSAIVTKPSDEQCVELIKSKINAGIHEQSSNSLMAGIGSMLLDFSVKKPLFRIEDKIFYKKIYFILGDEPIGTACFGTVVISSN